MWGRNSGQTNQIDELAKRASKGDRKAFDELVRLTHSDAFTLAMRLTNNTEDAADATQEAYVRIQRSITKFRGDSAFGTWMYRVVANCAANQLARRNKHSHDELDAHDVVDVRSTTATQQPLSVDRDQLAEALKELPDPLRAVIVLRDLYDMTHRDIAVELGINEATAKVRLHRARKSLAAKLSKLRDPVDSDVGSSEERKEQGHV